MADTAGIVGQEPERPIARVLTAGARRAERMAHATGVDRALNQAAEEAIVRALRSPAVVRAIERALDNDDAETDERDEEAVLLVRRILASDAADRVWTEVLESEQTQKLVERIAGAPEIRAAITAQGAGLITDIGVRLTVITERLDDALERVTRPRDHEAETDQAGLATRAVAAAIDLGLLFAAYSLISSVITSLVAAVFGQHPSGVAGIVLAGLGLVVGGATFAAFWALAGQTPGMRFLAIRLTTRGSPALTFGCAVRRVLAVIISLLPFGLGYLAILRDPQRRAWADRLTGTEVIYDSVARSGPRAGERRTPGARG
jgi:uncharacterized RDD family membrane protein YckC